jgi:FSR family fosmidomycin resistance protein-like MFS transporter
MTDHRPTGYLSDPSKANPRVIFALWLVHFTGDLYASFVSPLLPFFADLFALSLTQVGLLAGVNRFLMFIVQPIAGYFADHYRTRLFVLGGPLLSLVFIPLVGVAPSFFILILFVALGSIGQAMFHPPVAGMIASYAGRHFSFCMSIFNAGGTLAFGVGPVVITALVAAYGPRGTLLSMLIGLPLLALMFKLVPRPEAEGLAARGFIGSLKEALGGAWKSIALLWVVMTLRAFVSQVFITFFPMLYARDGYALLAIGVVTSLFTLAGAFSGLVAGSLADRTRYRPIFILSHLLTAPALLLSLHLRGDWIYPCAFLAGFFSMATLPLGVALGQRLAPRGRSMVSSLMMGLSLGIGGVLSPVIGSLADVFSLPTVLAWLPIVPLLTMLLCLRLPENTVAGFGSTPSPREVP